MILKNKVVVITGGSKGIGRASAEAFLEEGARVFICSRKEEEIKKAAEDLSKKGNCTAIKCDISNSLEVESFIKKIVDREGSIDILINNAGLSIYKNITDMSEEEWDRIISVNLKGTFLLCKKTISHIKKGIIVNISSGAGKKGFGGFSAYCASKFGVIGLTESIAEEFPEHKIYALCPGPVNTEMFRNIFNYSPPCSPSDIARLLVEICKKENYPSGASILPG